MNALDQPISEVSVKIDNEDMNILLDCLYAWGNTFKAESVEQKMNVFSMRKLKQKLEIRIAQTKGTTKLYTLKIEPVQAYALMNILDKVYNLLAPICYERNVCRKYKDEFHQKLLAI